MHYRLKVFILVLIINAEVAKTTTSFEDVFFSFKTVQRNIVFFLIIVMNVFKDVFLKTFKFCFILI